MKKALTISVITGYLLFMGALGIFAAVPTKATKTARVSKENIQREITRTISCPNFIVENTGTNIVRAIVQIDESGKIKIDEINASSEQLKNYVMEQLQDMTVKNVTNPEKFVLLIRFVVS